MGHIFKINIVIKMKHFSYIFFSSYLRLFPLAGVAHTNVFTHPSALIRSPTSTQTPPAPYIIALHSLLFWHTTFALSIVIPLFSNAPFTPPLIHPFGGRPLPLGPSLS